MAQITKITTEECEFDTGGRMVKKTTTERVAVTELDQQVLSQLMGAVDDRVKIHLDDFDKHHSLD